MKTLKELTEIGTKACQNVGRQKLYGNLCVKKHATAYASDSIFREAFAQAIKTEVEKPLLERISTLEEAMEYWVKNGASKTEDKPSLTFDLHGKTWTRHTPGDPRPCDGSADVFVLLRWEEKAEPRERRKSAALWNWDCNSYNPGSEIIGWCYANKPTIKTIPLDIGDIRATDEFRRTVGAAATYPAGPWDNEVISLGSCPVRYSELAANFLRRQHGSDQWKPCTKEVSK